MIAKNWLQADVLDILFHNRNKAYGAYELRKTYRVRLLKSLLVVTLFTSVIYAFLPKKSTGNWLTTPIDVVELLIQPNTTKKVEVNTSQHSGKTFPKPKSAYRAEVAPTIVKNELWKQHDTVPTIQADVSTANTQNAGNATNTSLTGTGVSNIFTGNGNGTVINITPAVADTEAIVQHPDVEAQFPGGIGVWKQYVERNLDILAMIQEGATPGTYTVVVQFLVDELGNITQVQTIANSSELDFGSAQQAERIIQRGPKWIPAQKNGRAVSSIKKQRISFIVQE